MKIEIKDIDVAGFFNTEIKSLAGTLFLDGKSAGTITVKKGIDFTTHEEITVIERKVIQGPEAVPQNDPKDRPIDVFGLYDQFLNEKQSRNFFNSLLQRMSDQLLIGNNINSVVSLKLNTKISWALASPEGHESLAKLIRKHVLPELSNSYRLLNRNIPKDILLKAGIENGKAIATKKNTIKGKKALTIKSILI